MNKNEILKKYAQNEDERLLLARVLDKMTACEQKNTPQQTAFLDPAEQRCASRILGENHLFYGGYEGAERKALFFLPDYMEKVTESLPELGFVRAKYVTSDKLSHRDFLGSLMGLGIKRDTVGDILPYDGGCDLVVMREVLPFVLQNFEQAGRTKLSVSEISAEELQVPVSEFKLIKDTVMSLRLDAVLSTGFSISREKAAAAVRSGKVQLNYTDCDKVDKTVAQGDVISWRGSGKIELAEVGGLSKKGRIGIVVKRYI